MSPVNDVVPDASASVSAPAGGRLKGLFSRKSQPTSPTDAHCTPVPPSPPPLATFSPDYDDDDDGDVDVDDYDVADTQGSSWQASGNSARSKLRSLFAEGTRPASQAVRALGHGFPSSSSLRESARRAATQQQQPSAAGPAPLTPSMPADLKGCGGGVIDPVSLPSPAVPTFPPPTTTTTTTTTKSGASSSCIQLVPPPPPPFPPPPPASRSQRNLGQSLLKGSRSTPALVPRKDKDALRATPARLAMDDTETRKKGRSSFARLFTKKRNVSAPAVPLTPTAASNAAINLDSPGRASPTTPRGLAIIAPNGGLYPLDQSNPSSPTPRAMSRTSSLGAIRPLSRPTSSSALRAESSRAMPNLVYSAAHRPPMGAGSTPSLSPLSQSGTTGMSLSSPNLQSPSLSQTSLILPDPSSRIQLLSKDHYHLRFASTYVINLIAPALKTANFSKSARNMEVKRITEDRLALLMRMERTWGSSWTDAATELLSGAQSGASTEVQEAKLRACNITATAKARERKVFVSAMRDGILFCFLFNRLFPSQPAAIQRVKVPKDDTRISANIDRFLAACREQGVPESELFTLANLDENSPSGLAYVSRTILILAEMASPSVIARANAISSARSIGLKPSPSSERLPSAATSKPPPARSNLSSESSPRSTFITPPVASRSIYERPLRSSSSDLLARLQRESGGSSNASTTGTATSVASVATSSVPSTSPLSSRVPSIGPISTKMASSASGVASPTAMTPIDSSNKTHAVSRLSASVTATPPLSPVSTSAAAAATPTTPVRSSSSTHGTPPTARPMTRTLSSSKAQVSFKPDTGLSQPSVHDWSSSVSSAQSTNHLSPLHERERTPSLVSTNSQAGSSYSRSIRGSVPTILDEDNRPIHAEVDFDPMESGTSSSLSHPRRMSEQTLQEARRKIIGTLLTSTEDLTLQPTPPATNRGSSLEEARGFALSQSLAALEGSLPSLAKPRSDSPRLRPVSRGKLSQSIELPQDKRLSEETGSVTPASTRPTSELPPRPRIRRLSANGKMYVPKRTNSPASPNLSLHGMSMITPGIPPLDPSSFSRPSTKEERRRSEDYAHPGVTSSNAHRIMNMRNHSMINLPATSRRTSTLSQGSRDSMVYPSLQVLNFAEAGKPHVRYQLGNCIGRGQFGSVYRSLNLSTGQMVAIKRIRLSGMKEAEVRDVMREVDLLQRLSHPGIVKYQGMSRDEAFLNIVLEFVENGSLGQTLRAFGRFNERLVASYVAKILEGLCYLHSEGVVHCDLKAANILSTKNGNIKLSDFGVSLNMRAVENFAERASMGRADAAKANEIAGTPNWMAPEIIKLAGASPKSDIWSLGCTIVELLTGKPPYSDVGNSMTVLFRIVEDPLPPLPDTSPALQDFLRLCFIKDPAGRPSAALLFDHEWVRAGHGDIITRPQDSLPFIRRVSQEPNHRTADSRRVFSSSAALSAGTPGSLSMKARVASASLIDLHAPRAEVDLNDTHNRAQMSMVSLHSNYHQSREQLNSTAAKAHALVKTTFAKSITCHVCLEGVKKAAYLCQNCGIITHSKCADRANARCDVRGQLALLASQQDWTVSNSSSRATSPQTEQPNPLTSLSGRLFGRNRSKASLLAAPSSTSLVEPPCTRGRRASSGAASFNSRPFETSTSTGGSASATISGADTVGSLRSRHSETSEDGGSLPHDRPLIRIDEDGPAGNNNPYRRSPVIKVMEPPIEGGAPRRRASMRLLPQRKGKKNEPEEQKSDCIIG